MSDYLMSHPFPDGPGGSFHSTTVPMDFQLQTPGDAVVHELRPGPAIPAADGSSTKLCVVLHPPSNQVFALKSVTSTALPREMRQLENEEFALQKLKGCSNVVQLLHSLSTESEGVRTKSLLLEYVSGGSFSAVLKHCGGALPEQAVRRYARGVLQGLADVHAQGLVHCDVKGANILICKNTQDTKLCSFGYSMQQGDALKRVKKKQRLQGTYNWMAPEVMRQEDQTQASDVWSYGCTVLELLTGVPPWSDHAKADSLTEIIGYGAETPPLPDFVSAECKNFLQACLQREPEDRPTAQQLLQHPFCL